MAGFSESLGKPSGRGLRESHTQQIQSAEAKFYTTKRMNANETTKHFSELWMA